MLRYIILYYIILYIYIYNVVPVALVAADLRDGGELSDIFGLGEKDTVMETEREIEGGRECI